MREIAVRVAPGGEEDLLDDPRQDQLTFDWLYRRYSDALRRFCQSRLDGDPNEAEDACHESFLKAYEALKRYRPNAMWPWLATIAANVCIGIQRKRSRTICTGDVTVSSPGRTEAEADRRIRAQIVDRALTNLPEHYRTALYLHEYEGWSYEQLAQLNKTSVRATASVLFRARKALKKQIKPVAQKAGQWPLPLIVPLSLEAKPAAPKGAAVVIGHGVPTHYMLGSHFGMMLAERVVAAATWAALLFPEPAPGPGPAGGPAPPTYSPVATTAAESVISPDSAVASTKAVALHLQSLVPGPRMLPDPPVASLSEAGNLIESALTLPPFDLQIRGELETLPR